MAVRTATQLKSDAAAANSALATAVATPTVANITAAATAFQTVVTNGRDSENARSARRVDMGSIAADLQVLARIAARDLALVQTHAVSAQGTVDTAAARKMLQRVQRTLVSGGWQSVAALPTTS